MLKLNADLMTKVMTQIEWLDSLPTQEIKDDTAVRDWYQESYRSLHKDAEQQRCKTSMCFAGWAVELDPRSEWVVTERMVLTPGVVMRSASNEYMRDFNSVSIFGEYVRVPESRKDEEGITAFEIKWPDGKVETVYGIYAEQAGAELLGLSEVQTGVLFSGSNSVDRLKDITNALLEGKDVEDLDDEDEDDDF